MHPGACRRRALHLMQAQNAATCLQVSHIRRSEWHSTPHTLPPQQPTALHAHAWCISSTIRSFAGEHSPSQYLHTLLRMLQVISMMGIRKAQQRGSPAHAAQPEEQLLLNALVRHHLLHPSPHPCRLLRLLLLLLRQAAGMRWLQGALRQGSPADWAGVIARYPPASMPAQQPEHWQTEQLRYTSTHQS